MAEEMYDASILLDFSRDAQLIDMKAVGLSKDEVYEIRWEVPLGAFNSCKDWIYANRRTLRDFTVEFREFTELYRTVSVTADDQGKSRNSVQLVHRIAKGLLASLVTDSGVNWDEARKITGRSLEGNDEAAPDSIANTTSDDQERHITIEWPFCDPLKIDAIISSLSDSTYTNPTIEGEEITGVWHRIMVSYQRGEDGACAVRMQLAEPQYTLNAYRELETVSGSDVVYLWQVPKDLAQGIMDAWKVATPTAGRMASASYDSSGGLVNITLTRLAGSPPNLTLSAIPTACDEATTYHFAWRYTEDEMETFILAHSGTLGANMRRDVNVRTRSDGFFDIIVTERVITFNEDKHIVQVNTVRGNHLVERHFGWNCPMSEIDSRRTAFEVSAEGITSTFSVRRQDDCSFDYEGTIQVRNITTKSVDLGGTGIQVRSLAGDALTQDELEDLATGFESAIRKRVSADIRVDDDGLASARFTETEVQKAETSADTGTEGVVVAVMTGRNVDAADLSDIYETAAREQVSLELSANDDGSFNYTARKATVQEVVESMSSTLGSGISVSVKSGKNVDSGDLTGVILGGARTRVSASLSANDDGTLNYSVVEQSMVEFEDNWAIAKQITTGVGTVVYEGRNADASDLDLLIPTFVSDATRSFQIRVTPNDDGTINYTVVKTTIQASSNYFELEKDAPEDDGIEIIIDSGRNKTSTELTNIFTATGGPDASGYTPGPRKSHDIRVGVNDAGGWDYTIVERTVKASGGSTSSGAGGVMVTALAGRNVDSDDLADLATSAARTNVQLSLSANDDGTFNYTASTSTVQKVIEEMTTSAAEGITTSIKSGKNVDPSEIIGIAEGGRRSRVNLSLSANDDGTLNYTVVEQTLVEFSDDFSISDSGTTGVGVRSYVGQSVDPATLDAVVASLTASNTKSFQINVDPNDDETINYKIVESTTQAAEDSFAIPAGVTDGLGLEVATGTNKSAADVLAAVSSYSSGARKSHEMRMSLNDAGGWNYTVAERTVQKVTGAATSGAAGIAVDSFAGSNVDAAELVGIVESGAAKRVRINISTNDDGTFNYSGTKQTLQSVEDSWSAAGTGQQIEVWFGRNLDSITEVITTDHLSEVSLDPSLNDDGTINYRAIKRTKVETQKWAGHFGAAMPDYGIQTRVLYGRNATPGDLSSLMASYPPAARTQHSLQVSANDSGGIDYTLREVEINDAEAEWNVGLGAIEGLPVTIKTGNNVELTEVDAAIASFAVGIGINHQLSLSGNDDGTFDYVARQVTEQKAKGSIDSTPGANPGMSIFAESAINVNAADLASVLELSARERASVSVSPQTDGGFGYSIVKQTLVESDEEVVTSGGAGFGVNTEVSHGENLLPADLAAKVFETGARIRWDMSLSANPDGTLNYNARKTEVVEVTGDAEIRNPTEGIGWLVAVGGNEEITVQDVTKGMSGEHGVQHTVRIVPNDDGTLNYVVTERRSQKAVSSDTIPASSGTPSYGEEVTVTTGRYQGNADMSAVLTALSGAARSRIVDLKVSANDDGSFNYFVLQRSRQTGLVENRKIGAINRLVTLNIGDFEDDFPATFPATPPTGTTLKLTARSNPDGTLTYRTEEIEAKHMAGPGPLRHGTFTQQQETDVVRNSQWEPSTATPTQGVSHRVEKMTRNDDGTVDYMLTKIEREPVSEPIVLARRNTARESAGYTYNATVFKGVTTLPAGSGDYWYFSSIAIESDGTFTGVLNDIVIGDPNLTTLGIGGAGGTFIKRHYKSVAITGGYELYMRKTTFNYQIIMTRNQPTAITFMSSGDSDVDRSNVRIVSVEGVQWFRAVRVTYGTEGQWGLVAPPTP